VLLIVLCTSFLPAALYTYEGLFEPEVSGSGGFGTIVVIYDSTAHTLIANFDWNNLTGTTTMAHLHCCVDAPGTAGVATYPGTFPSFPVGVTGGTYSSPTPIDLTLASSYSSTFLTNAGGTPALAELALFNGLGAGRAYLNIHTSFATGGEIRDFLTLIPEPSAFLLTGSGILIAALLRLRRQSPN